MFGHNFAGFAASHVTPGMVARGKAELKRYAEPLAKIEQRFGVPGPVLVAIWGQETSFGGDNGSFPTYSALATLAWDCRRAERYRAELVDALMLVERGIVQHPRQLRGAWAGEIGQTQLMPSAYLMFATTPDGTGTPDLIHNSADALASTANFLKAHGWQPGRAGTKASRTSPPSCNGTRPRFTPRQSRCSPTGWLGGSCRRDWPRRPSLWRLCASRALEGRFRWSGVARKTLARISQTR